MRTTVLLVAACALSIHAFAAAPLTRFEFAEVHMGTRVRIVLYARDEPAARRATRAAFDRIATLDDTMSDYKPASELMRLCDQAGGPPVGISDDLFRVLEASQELSRRSDGAFDVTIGPLVRLWRLARVERKVPDARAVAGERALVGYQNLRLDAKARTAQLLKPEMVLDLGAIGKGFAADEALAVLKEQGIACALVAAGGDIAVSGSPPGQKGWRIGIAPLESPDMLPRLFILLRDGAVSTSGDAERHLDAGGVRYSHIIDPRTGMGLEGRSSVTVVARTGTESDGMATAVSVLGPKRGLELIRRTPGAGVLFVREKEGRVETLRLRFPRTEGRSQESESKSQMSKSGRKKAEG